MPRDLARPLGRIMVLDIESAPDPAAVAIAGKGDQIARTALHRLEAYAVLHAVENDDGEWTDIGLDAAARDTELPMLAAISEDLANLAAADGLIVTYNGLAHDAPVLRRRMIANWAFGLYGIGAIGSMKHLDLIRAGQPIGRPASLRDACAGLGISVNHLPIARGREPTVATVRKSQVDVVGTFLLLLHETAAARLSPDPLAAGWRALSDHLGSTGVRAPHLEQFRLPALLEKRFIKLLKLIGCKVKKVALDATFDVKHDSIDYVRVIIVVARQLYDALCDEGLHWPDSPHNVRNWRTMGTGLRLAWTKARKYHPVFGAEHAGHRFFGRSTGSEPLMLYDPYDTVRQLDAAIDGIDSPQLVRDLRDVQRANGLRYGDFNRGNALGWVRAGLGDHFWCNNKFARSKLVKTAALPSDVRMRMTARLEAVPHPTDASLTLMDRIRELAPTSAIKGKAGEAARRELAGYLLFGRDGATGEPKYSYYSYWLRRAVAIHGVVIQTNRGPWSPTSVVYRKAAISLDVRALFQRTADKAEREAGLLEIADKYHHRVDMTRTYAAWEYKLESIRTRLEQAAKRDLDIAQDLAGVPAPVRTGRIELPAARAAMDRLRSRPSQPKEAA